MCTILNFIINIYALVGTRFMIVYLSSNKVFNAQHFEVTFLFSCNFNGHVCTGIAICDALRDLMSFVQFEECEKYPWRNVFFSQVAGFCTICTNGTKLRQASHIILVVLLLDFLFYFPSCGMYIL